MPNGGYFKIFYPSTITVASSLTTCIVSESGVPTSLTSCVVDTTNKIIYMGNNFNTAYSTSGYSLTLKFGAVTNPSVSNSAYTFTMLSYDDSSFTYEID